MKEAHAFAARFRWPGGLRFPLVIGHRGASGHARENTLKAFALASDLGADMWELDAQVTRDGICVVSHDDHLQRVFGVDARISEMTVAELARLPGVEVPTFEAVAALARARDAGLYVELKAAGSGPLVRRHLEERSQHFAAIGSFRIDLVRELHEGGCAFPLSVLVPLGVDPVAAAEEAGADIMHLCWERGGERPQDLVTPRLVREAAEAGRRLVLWHEERPAVLSELVKLPVIGICSDLPERVRSAINPMESA